jgi:hypothetical protein
MASKCPDVVYFFIHNLGKTGLFFSSHEMRVQSLSRDQLGPWPALELITVARKKALVHLEQSGSVELRWALGFVLQNGHC